MKKVLAVILTIAVLAVFAAVPAFAMTAQEDIPDDAVMYVLDMDNISEEVDYESAVYDVEDFTMTSATDLGAAGVSFMDPLYSNVKIASGENAISGEQSLWVKGYLDSRRWSMSLLEGVGDYVFIEYKIKVLAQSNPGDNLFYVCITDDDIVDEEGNKLTANEGDGGKVGKIVCGDPNPQFLNNDGEVIYTFPSINEVYKVGIAIEYGTDNYDLYIDGVRVSTGNKWVGALNNITGMRWDMHGSFGDAAAIQADPREIIIDDIYVTYGQQVSKADYFATPTPTPEPTPEPTATPEATAAPEVTAAPEATAKPDPSDEPKKGCGAVVASSAIVTAITLLSVAVVLKKKEN